VANNLKIGASGYKVGEKRSGRKVGISGYRWVQVGTGGCKAGAEWVRMMWNDESVKIGMRE